MMTKRYPSISRRDCARIVPTFLSGETAVLPDEAVNWKSSGPELDLEELKDVATEIETDRQEFAVGSQASDRDMFEGMACGKLHAAMRAYPIRVLDDPSFWRYVALEYFWPLSYWREQGTFDKGDHGRYLKYVDASVATECVVTRMFLRAQAVQVAEGDDYSLAHAVPKGTDFWRSHVLRVSVGSAPPVTRAFVNEQAANRMPTSELRSYARRLNRVATNLVFPLLDDEDAAGLISDLRTD